MQNKFLRLKESVTHRLSMPLCLIAAFSMASCGKKSSGSSNSTPPPSEEQKTSAWTEAQKAELIKSCSEKQGTTLTAEQNEKLCQCVADVTMKTYTPEQIGAQKDGDLKLDLTQCSGEQSTEPSTPSTASTPTTENPKIEVKTEQPEVGIKEEDNFLRVYHAYIDKKKKWVESDLPGADPTAINIDINKCEKAEILLENPKKQRYNCSKHLYDLVKIPLAKVFYVDRELTKEGTTKPNNQYCDLSTIETVVRADIFEKLVSMAFYIDKQSNLAPVLKADLKLVKEVTLADKSLGLVHQFISDTGGLKGRCFSDMTESGLALYSDWESVFKPNMVVKNDDGTLTRYWSLLTDDGRYKNLGNDFRLYESLVEPTEGIDPITGEFVMLGFGIDLTDLSHESLLNIEKETSISP